jgi:crossover junction endodeoxyribonuclease RuvC
MSDKTIYIGIDPGATGAIAFINPYDNALVKVFDFEDGEALSHLQWVAETSPSLIKAVLEKVSSMPGQGVSSTFKFGTNFGTWIGRLEALMIPFDFVTPQKWRKVIFDSAAKSVDLKAMSVSRALRIFPHMAEFLKRKKDHGRAEALLLAEYARITDHA